MIYSIEFSKGATKNMAKYKKTKRASQQNTNGEKSYYKGFVLSCIILLVGIFLPEKLGVHYLNFGFVYMIVVPLFIILFGYFKILKKSSGASLYMSLWASFCVTFTLYAIIRNIQ